MEKRDRPYLGITKKHFFASFLRLHDTLTENPNLTSKEQIEIIIQELTSPKIRISRREIRRIKSILEEEKSKPNHP